MVLADNEPDTPSPLADPEAASHSAAVNAGPVPASELSKPADPPGPEAWWDVEDACFVDEDLHPLPTLELEGSESALAPIQSNSRHSPGRSQEQTNAYGDDSATRSASEEPAPRPLPTLLEKNGGSGSREDASDLERNIQMASEEQVELLAASPSSPHPRRSAEPTHPRTDQGRGQGSLEELRYSSRPRSQEQDKEGPHEPQEHEVAVDEMRQGVVDEEEESEDRDDNGKREQRGVKRQHQGEEISSGIY